VWSALKRRWWRTSHLTLLLSIDLAWFVGMLVMFDENSFCGPG
jgi:hypothetical protein